MKRELIVYLHQTLAGRLIQDESGRMSFAYDREYLRASKMPLSQSLPLREAPFDQRECRGFFAGLLPEESGRHTMARVLGISPRNDYAMLEKIGGECAGAVTFLEDGRRPQQALHVRSLSENELSEILQELPKRPLLAGEKDLRLSLAGVQHKIALCVDDKGQFSLPLGGTPSTHILKPASNSFPDIVSNEAMCLHLAESIGIPTIKFKTGCAGQTEYLLVKRYDRLQTEGPSPQTLRLHQEDFCQALGIAPERKYQSEGGPSLKRYFALLREASTSPAVDIHNLFKITVLNMAVGNHDAHAKNVSLLYTSQETRLAPAYDILSTVYYPELTQKAAVKIGRRYEWDQLIPKDIKHFAESIGLHVGDTFNNMERVIKSIQENLGPLKGRYPNSERLIELIRKRAEYFAEVCLPVR